MNTSAFCVTMFAFLAVSSAAPSGVWPVVTYAQSYSAHTVDHSVAQPVYPAVAAAPVLKAAPAVVAEPLVAAPYLAPSPYYARSAPYVARSPYFGAPAVAPYVASPFVSL